MFDIGFPELLIVSVVALLVLGPERLPEALRTLGLWISRIRRSFMNVKAEIEREIGADDLRREIYNEEVLEQSGQFKSEIQSVVDDFNQPLVPDEGASDDASATDDDAVAHEDGEARDDAGAHEDSGALQDSDAHDDGRSHRDAGAEEDERTAQEPLTAGPSPDDEHSDRA